MRGSVLTKIAVLTVVIIFALCSGLALAAEKSWFVQKDKNGVCSVHQLKAKTDKTIAGPFPTKDAATKAKEEKCPKKPEKTPKPK
ncbi:MAG: hypothetical protein ACLQPD_07370 [Desulfomonilaceae bacterium]